MAEVTAIILCGGRSTRMGQDKASLRFGDETMLDRISRIVREIADEVIVVGREEHGPLSGIAAGLAASTTDLNIVVACDMPLIKPAVLQRMASMIEDDDLCVAVVDDHPSVLCGVYRSRIAKEVQALLEGGERRVMRLLDRVKTKRVDAAAFRDIDPNLETFLSVDTPGAYQKLTRISPIT